MYDFNAALDAIELVGPQDLGRQLEKREYAEFEAEEYMRRYARLSTLMRREGIDAALFSQRENVRYFSGYLSVLWISRFRPFVCLLPTDPALDSSVIVSGQEMGNARATSWVQDPVVFSPQEPPIPTIVDTVRARGLNKGRIAIELGFGQRLGMNQEQWAELQAALPDVEWVDGTVLSQCVRMLKSPSEVERLAESSRISCMGLRAGFGALREGMTERELLKVVAVEMFQQGAELGIQPAVFGIQAGDRWVQSNAVATNYAIKRGDVVLLDGGATFRGYVTDFIRQASLGQPSADYRRVFDLLVECNRVCRNSIAPGVTACSVYQAALDFLAAEGLAAFNKMNIVGHGIGADIHELPWIGEADTVYTSDIRLRRGMVLAIEPAIAIRDASLGPLGSYIVEENLEVTESGHRVLTDAMPPDLYVCD